jgi:hypothetical protein
VAEPLKTFVSPGLVHRLAADIVRVEPAFPSRTFIKQAIAGLEDDDTMSRAAPSDFQSSPVL